MKEKGILFILSGPSGVGKGTVRKQLFRKDPNLKYSISMTTREPRVGEKDGIDYFYRSKEHFKELIEKNAFIEHAQYVNNHYGTPKEYVENMLSLGHDVFLEIEVQGALQVKGNYEKGIFIFLLPPSLEDLKTRILKRGTESEELVLNRLKEARNEIEMMEEYDYVVVNDNVHHAVRKIESIIQSEHCKRERVAKQYKQLLEVE